MTAGVYFHYAATMGYVKEVKPIQVQDPSPADVQEVMFAEQPTYRQNVRPTEVQEIRPTQVEGEGTEAHDNASSQSSESEDLDTKNLEYYKTFNDPEMKAELAQGPQNYPTSSKKKRRKVRLNYAG